MSGTGASSRLDLPGSTVSSRDARLRYARPTWRIERQQGNGFEQIRSAGAASSAWSGVITLRAGAFSRSPVGGSGDGSLAVLIISTPALGAIFRMHGFSSVQACPTSPFSAGFLAFQFSGWRSCLTLLGGQAGRLLLASSRPRHRVGSPFSLGFGI